MSKELIPWLSNASQCMLFPTVSAFQNFLKIYLFDQEMNRTAQWLSKHLAKSREMFKPCVNTAEK